MKGPFTNQSSNSLGNINGRLRYFLQNGNLQSSRSKNSKSFQHRQNCRLSNQTFLTLKNIEISQLLLVSTTSTLALRKTCHPSPPSQLLNPLCLPNPRHLTRILQYAHQLLHQNVTRRPSYSRCPIHRTRVQGNRSHGENWRHEKAEKENGMRWGYTVGLGEEYATFCWRAEGAMTHDWRNDTGERNKWSLGHNG